MTSDVTFEVCRSRRGLLLPFDKSFRDEGEAVSYAMRQEPRSGDKVTVYRVARTEVFGKGHWDQQAEG